MTALKPSADPAAAEGRSFAGWYTADGTEYTAWNTRLSADIALYARFASLWSGTDDIDTSWYTSNAASDTYDISTASALAGLASLINDGTITGSITVNLNDDIDLAGLEWTPIGYGDRTSESAPAFTGVFNGNGHLIVNLSVSGSADKYPAGLFGLISDASINDLKIKSGSVSHASDTAAGIAGAARRGNSESTIKNCFNAADVSAKGSTTVDFVASGGILGRSDYGKVTVTGCSNSGAVTVSSALEDYYELCAGGIAGLAEGSLAISGSSSSGEISGTGAFCSLGGILGSVLDNSGALTLTIDNCTNVGAVSSGGYVDDAGGIVGGASINKASTVSVTGSVNKGSVDCGVRHVTVGINSGKAGGIAGGAYASSGEGSVTIASCSNEGAVSAHQSANYAGVIVGYIQEYYSLTITGCANTGSVSAATPANVNYTVQYP